MLSIGHEETLQVVVSSRPGSGSLDRPVDSVPRPYRQGLGRKTDSPTDRPAREDRQVDRRPETTNAVHREFQTRKLPRLWRLDVHRCSIAPSPIRLGGAALPKDSFEHGAP